MELGSREDIEEATLWEAGIDNEDAIINLDDIISLSSKGFRHCIEFCPSRETCGKDACFCVRASFDHPSFYSLYKLGRKKYLELLSLGIIAINAQEDISVPKNIKGEKTND
tara:strand:+ start:119 stop:451 length:333 start_codon:yes stop_codon:yes gene_type:complete